jgi:mannitol operon repressor
VTHPHLAEFSAFLPELNKETDRGMVLFATSFIDELMRRTLLAFLLESETSSSLVEGFNAPLGSLLREAPRPLPWGSFPKGN